MKRLSTLVTGLLIMGTSAFAQLTLVEDDFSDRSKFFDVSLTNMWEPVGDYQSAFLLAPKSDKNSLSYNAIYLDSLAAANKRYTIAEGLRESTAFDYNFEGILSRTNNVITLEFDMLWKYLSSGGQDRRMVCALVYDLPEGGVQNDILDSIHLEAPFGRPAYNFRIFNRTNQGTNNYANIFHGGGSDMLGEFEKTSTYWLPGFISGPGSISPESSAQYPVGPVDKWMTNPVAELNTWTHITLVVTDTTLKYYRRNTGAPASEDLLIGDLYTPVLDDTASVIAKLNAYYGTSITELPSQYHYFETFEAIRFFMNGDSTYIANVKVQSLQEPEVPEPPVSIEKVKNVKSAFSIYPTLAESYLNVNYEGQATANVFNINGSIVKTVNISGNTSIPVYDLPSGLYLIKIDQQAYRFIVK